MSGTKAAPNIVQVATVQVDHIKLEPLLFEAERTSAALQAYETYAPKHGHTDPLIAVTLWGQAQARARHLLQQIKESGLCRGPVQYLSSPATSEAAEGLIMLSQAVVELVAGLPESISLEPGVEPFRFDSMFVDRINIAVEKLRLGISRELNDVTQDLPASSSSGRSGNKGKRFVRLLQSETPGETSSESSKIVSNKKSWRPRDLKKAKRVWDEMLPRIKKGLRTSDAAEEIEEKIPELDMTRTAIRRLYFKLQKYRIFSHLAKPG